MTEQHPTETGGGAAVAPREEPAREVDHLIGLAQIEFEGLHTPSSIEEAVKASWHPGASRELYNRKWIITKILDSPSGGFFGKIGFVKEAEVQTLTFDEEVSDFIEGEAPSGVTVPFFISNDGKVSYQLIANVVREATFIRAFTELMHAGSGLYTWKLTPLSIELEYGEWFRSIEKVTKFDFTLDRPNPHYGDDHLIEELIEGTKSARLRLAGTAATNGSIETDSEPFRQALDHVIKNYGRATIAGIDENNTETVWTKLKGAASRTLARVKSRGPGPQASVTELVSAIATIPAGSQPVALSDNEDEIAG